jgi:putative membrane protein
MADDSSTRDRLAVERTVLANERTLLAYVRTALAFAIAGASAIHFLDSPVVDVLGWISVAAGVVTAAIGAWRFVRTRRQLAGSSSADR